MKIIAEIWIALAILVLAIPFFFSHPWLLTSWNVFGLLMITAGGYFSMKAVPQTHNSATGEVSLGGHKTSKEDRKKLGKAQKNAQLYIAILLLGMVFQASAMLADRCCGHGF